MAENKIVANNGSSIVLYSTDDGNIPVSYTHLTLPTICSV